MAVRGILNWRSQNVQTATAGVLPSHLTTRSWRFGLVMVEIGRIPDNRPTTGKASSDTVGLSVGESALTSSKNSADPNALNGPDKVLAAR
jgi:hypothetical protein